MPGATMVSRRAGQLRAAGAAPCGCRRTRRGFRPSSAATRRGSSTSCRGPSCAARWPRWRCTCAKQGVQPGDRVAAYLPNIPETMVAFLATVSIGAVWSVCAPDMGTNAVLDRFRQIDPKVLIACDGVTYGGRDLDRWAWWPRCAPPCPRCATCSCTAIWATRATTNHQL
jgi:hypothetical protein